MSGLGAEIGWACTWFDTSTKEHWGFSAKSWQTLRATNNKRKHWYFTHTHAHITTMQVYILWGISTQTGMYECVNARLKIWIYSEYFDVIYLHNRIVQFLVSRMETISLAADISDTVGSYFLFIYRRLNHLYARVSPKGCPLGVTPFTIITNYCFSCLSYHNLLLIYKLF